MTSTACADWADRLRAGRPPVADGLVTCSEEADRAAAIFGRQRLPDVPGKPTLTEAGAGWFVDGVVRPIFGSFDPDTGKRRIREVLVLVPKKNSKTTNSAAMMNTAAMTLRRENIQINYLGPSIEVARTAFEQAVGMIEADEELRKRWHLQEYQRAMTFRPRKIEQKIRSLDPKTTTGMLGPFLLVDELHVMAEMNGARRVLRQALGGLMPFEDGCAVFITTQSEKPPAGVFAEKLEYARKVRDGVIQDETFLPVLFEMPEPEAQDWREPKHWWIVNPNLGRSTHRERLERDYRTAAVAGPHELAEWASQYLNVQIGQALRADGWAGAAFWAGARDVVACGSLDEVLERSEVAAVGIDGGGLDDLMGAAVIGRERVTRRWLVWVHAWAHPVALERRKADAPRLLDFVRDGDLTLVERMNEDVDGVAALCDRVRRSGLLAKPGIGVDPAGIGSIVDALADLDFDPKEDIAAVSQGWKMTGAVKTLERKVADGSLVHGGQRLLAWCVANAKVEPRGNAIVVTKEASGSGKIDPFMAVLDAATIMATNPAARRAARVAWGGDRRVLVA